MAISFDLTNTGTEPIDAFDLEEDAYGQQWSWEWKSSSGDSFTRKDFDLGPIPDVKGIKRVRVESREQVRWKLLVPTPLALKGHAVLVVRVRPTTLDVEPQVHEVEVTLDGDSENTPKINEFPTWIYPSILAGNIGLPLGVISKDSSLHTIQAASHEDARWMLMTFCLQLFRPRKEVFDLPTWKEIEKHDESSRLIRDVYLMRALRAGAIRISDDEIEAMTDRENSKHSLTKQLHDALRAHAEKR